MINHNTYSKGYGRNTNVTKTRTVKPNPVKNQSKSAYAPQPRKTSSGAYSTEGNLARQEARRPRQNTFAEQMRNQIASVYDMSNLTLTTNGAVAYSTSGSNLLDLHFSITKLRGASDQEIYTQFRTAFAENPIYAIRWLFWCRDCREGNGERKLFRVCITDLANQGMAPVINQLISVIADYGRFDDLWCLLDTPCRKAVVAYVRSVWNADCDNFQQGKPITLLAKWMPSENASSAQTKKYANILMRGLNIKPSNYRKTLSALREHINVVERDMSSNNWQSIDYEAVPSKANLIYKNAFLRHDEERRRAYLDALSSGEAKINSSVAMPHEIVAKYSSSYMDTTLEGMWNALPNFIDPSKGDTMVVADGSGSMCTRVPGSRTVTCLNVAYALAIYFAERNHGEWKDKYITFSMRPKFVDLSNCKTLHDKLSEARRHSECENTNVEAVFDMILQTAINNGLSQEDLPGRVLILSDMQFDQCASGNLPSNRRYCVNPANKTLFEKIAARYKENGYTLPKLVFWNLCPYSTNPKNTIPMTQNEAGVILVSGYSAALAKSVLSAKTDPYEAMVETIMNKRYDQVETLAREGFKKLNAKKPYTPKKVTPSGRNRTLSTDKKTAMPKKNGPRVTPANKSYRNNRH